MKKCENCGKEYEPHFKAPVTKYCAEKCAFEAHLKRKKAKNICLRCPTKITEVNRLTNKPFIMCENCREKRKKGRNKEYKKHKQAYLNRANKSYKKNAKKISERNRKDRAYYKKKLFEIYGHCCKHCGLQDEGLLTIDHIGGGGAEHRRKIKCTLKLLKDVVENIDKTKYRILCMNCNWYVGQYRKPRPIVNINEYEDYYREG